MKKFENMYNRIISEMYTDEDFDRMDKYGLNTNWIKYLQANGFKELTDNRFVFQKESENVILQVNPEMAEINFLGWSGEVFHTVKDINRESDPAQVINSAIQQCYEALTSKAEAVKALA